MKKIKEWIKMRLQEEILDDFFLEEFLYGEGNIPWVRLLEVDGEMYKIIIKFEPPKTVEWKRYSKTK